MGWGGVGWGMSTSCRSYVDVTLMGWGGVGWGTVLAALKQFRELPMSSLQPTSKVWDAAPWKLWKNKPLAERHVWKQVRTPKKSWLSSVGILQSHSNSLRIPIESTHLVILPHAPQWKITPAKRFKQTTWQKVLFRVGKIQFLIQMLCR